MILGHVAGNIVATQKHEKFDSTRLLLVQPMALDGSPEGDEILAVDSVGAGPGETVLVVVEGRATSQSMGVQQAPANAAIIGIVDHVDLSS